MQAAREKNSGKQVGTPEERYAAMYRKHTSLAIMNAWGKEDERTHGVTYNKVMSSIVGVV